LSADRDRGVLWLSGFLWGLAEATAFFVVPDVLLSFIAQRRGMLAALAVMLFVVAGAVLGGLVMWWIGGAYPEQIVRFLDSLPAISPGMIEKARAAQAEAPFAVLLAGSLSGVPYKVFAATAQAAGVSASWFLLITIPARSVRFVLAIVATVLIDRVVSKWLSLRARSRILAAFWALFYAVFWAVMPG
jgi:membrane protein YqaA with SNARE-associated domain